MKNKSRSRSRSKSKRKVKKNNKKMKDCKEINKDNGNKECSIINII